MMHAKISTPYCNHIKDLRENKNSFRDKANTSLVQKKPITKPLLTQLPKFIFAVSYLHQSMHIQEIVIKRSLTNGMSHRKGFIKTFPVAKTDLAAAG